MLKISKSQVDQIGINTISTGMGSSIIELLRLVERKNRGLATELERRKIDLIVEVLDKTILDFGMDCNMDGIPDSIQDIDLDTMATTSCCRITDTPVNNSRRKKKTTSRR
jgi:hypothetical protein